MVKKIPIDLIKKSKYWKPSLKVGNQIKSNSWFDITCKKRKNIQTTKYKIEGEYLRCNKIKIKPNSNQIKILKTWLEICRQVYNLTVYYYKSHKLESKINMRKTIDVEIRKNKPLYKIIETSKIYKHTVDNAIFDVHKAFKSTLANLKCGNIKHFRIRYKKLKKSTQILVLEPTCFNKKGKGLKKKELNNLNSSDEIQTERDVRLKYDKNSKEYMLFISYNKKVKHVVNNYNKCSLDPGIRTFQTTYSDDGICYQIANNKKPLKDDIRRIENVKKFRKNQWYKKYTSRLYKRLKNRIDDLHWKTCKFLCSKFSTIIIGNMSTKSIVKNKKSCLDKISKKLCYILSHFKFKQRLKGKSEEYDVEYKEVDESYTSKTCGKCGLLNEKLGGSEIFKCDKTNCHYQMHRDIHGARNILIKHFG